MIAECVGLLSPFNVQSHKPVNESRRAIMFDIIMNLYALILGGVPSMRTITLLQSQRGHLSSLEARAEWVKIQPIPEIQHRTFSGELLLCCLQATTLTVRLLVPFHRTPYRLWIGTMLGKTGTVAEFVVPYHRLIVFYSLTVSFRFATCSNDMVE